MSEQVASDETVVSVNHTGALTGSENSPVVYGLGAFGLTSTAQALAGFYLFFYVDVLGLTVALAAVINIIYAIWDAVNDLVVGYLADNTRTRWGRAGWIRPDADCLCQFRI